MQSKRTEAGKLAFGRINKREAAVLAKGAKQIALVKWDFDKDGGEIGTLSFGQILPANAIVSEVYLDCLSEVHSATEIGTIMIKSGSTNLLSSALVVGAVGGIMKVVPTNPIKCSSAGELKMTIAVEKLTAGAMNICVEFFVSE